MKRIIAFVLCLSMLFSLVPVSAFAAEVDESTFVTETEPETQETVPAEAPQTQISEETEPAEETEPTQESAEVTEEAPTENWDTALSGMEETAPEETEITFTWISDVELPSTEELFAGYVEKTFYGDSAFFGTMAGDRLTGNAKIGYDEVRRQILEIAAGQRSSSEMTLRGFPDDDFPKDFLTNIFNALLADLPYEMYWFDKTNGVGGAYGYDSLGLYVKLYFSVSPHYSATGAAETFDLDTSKTRAASAAAANALSIVNKYADAGDYEKLVGYKKEICNMTSYNDHAASTNYNGGYGDPWQLIWVFDGLATTKVVCEGYSKAFQYLCDLSDFDADIVCYNVQGSMSGGGHMWNIVSINGKNYLADITNSDGGTIGSSGGLFLVGKAPNSDGSYTFLNNRFTYNDATIRQWGTGDGSILKLDTRNFDPDSLTEPPATEPPATEPPATDPPATEPPATEPDAPSVMTGEELQQILNAASGQYLLEVPAEVTSDLVIPEGLLVAVYGNASITVKNGGSITIANRAALAVANGGTLTAEAGSTITVAANGSLPVGGGTVVTIEGQLVNNGNMDITYGTVTVSGTYSGSGLVKKDQYATVTGIDSQLIHLYSYANDEAMLVNQLVAHEEYASTTVYLMCIDSNYDGVVDAPLTITGNVVVPDGVQLNLGYFVQDDQFILADGASLTVDGTMHIIGTSTLTINAGARLINNSYIANFGVINNNGIIKGTGELQQSGTLNGNAPLTEEEAVLDNFLAAVSAAEQSGDNVFVNDTIVLTEDLTIGMTGVLSFAPFTQLIIPSGVTLTVNGPISFNEAQLVVEAGGTLIHNDNLTISDTMGGGGKATVNGTVISNGTVWIVNGASMDINGTLNIQPSAKMYVYSNVSGNGIWNNAGTIRFGAQHSANGTDVYVGNADTFIGEYIHSSDAVLEVELFDGYPIGVNLISSNAQILVYEGSDPDSIYTAARNAHYTSLVTITEDVTIDSNLNVRNGNSLIVSENVTLTIQDELENWGNITVYGTLINNGTLFNESSLIIQESGTLINNANFHNNVFDYESCFLVLGTFINNGEMTGTAPSVPMTGPELIAALNAAEFGHYTLSSAATISGNLTLPKHTTLNLGHNGSLTVTAGSTLTCEGSLMTFSDSTVTVESGATLITNDYIGIWEDSIFTVDGTLVNNQTLEVGGTLLVNGVYRGNEEESPWIYQAETGIITGIDTSLITRKVNIHSEETLRQSVALGNTHKSLIIQIPEPVDITLSRDLVIPENVSVMVGTGAWDATLRITVPADVTLTNNGYISLDISGATLAIAENGQLINNGYLSNSGTLTVNGTLINNGQMNRFAEVDTKEELLAALAETPNYTNAEIHVTAIYCEGETLSITLTEDITIPQNTRVYAGMGGSETVDIYLTNGATLTNNGEFRLCTGYTTMHILDSASFVNNGEFCVEEGTTLIVDGGWSGNPPQGDGTIVGANLGFAIRVMTQVQPSFIENAGAFGLWAGAKTTFYPILYRIIDGQVIESNVVSVSYSEGAENYASIVNKGGIITVTAKSNLTSHQVISVTFSANNADPTTVNLHLRPKATGVDITLDGQSVTGQTIFADLNRGDRGVQLGSVCAPADAVPENGTLANGGSLVTWKSSAPAIATVDANGYVTFTGEKTGKVKITMSANYGATKSAVVTFNVVALPQELFSSATNPSVMAGGSNATFTATDAAGTVLKNNTVKWFLCNEAGNPIASHPYAAITAAGKLTTKAVADETLVFLMAQVIGDEQSALLAEPVCVILFPAVEYVQILLEGINANDSTLLYDIGLNGLTCQLDWAAGPYEESVQSVSWKSSKPAVADIDQNGRITVADANASGTVKFTLTVVGLNNKKHTASFTIKFGTFTQDLELSATLPDGTVTTDLTDLVICGGETLTFSGSCVPSNVTTDGIVWSLDSKLYGSISSKGVLKTKAVANPSTVTVTAASKDGYKAYSIDVTLMPQQGSLFIWNEFDQFLTKTTYTMMAGDSMQLMASKSHVSWKSSNTSVATVEADGWLTAVSNGTATITATAADGYSTTFTLKVSKMSSTVDITTKKGDPFIVVSGKSLDLVGTVTYSDDSTDKKVTWSITYPDGTAVPKTVATISSSGKVAAAKGLTSGTVVRVYADAKDGNCYGWTDLEILPATTAIEIFAPFGANGRYTDVSNTTQSWDMLNGTEFSFQAKVFPLSAMDTVTWKSSAPKVLEIDAEGNARCLKTGTVTITATAADGSGKKATFKLSVVKTMEFLELPETAVVGGGKSLALTKLDGYAIDTLASNQTLTWSMTYLDGRSVPASVATLSKGTLKTKAVTAPVDLIVRAEATDGSGKAADCIVTICPLTTAVSIVNAPAELYISSSVDLDAVCNPSGAAQEVTWKSSSTAVATVDADGVVTAWKAGTATITATAADGSGKKATAKIKVTEAPAVPPVTPPDTPASNEISLWTYPIGGWTNPSTVNSLVSSFEEETGIRVNVRYLNYADGDAMVNTAIAAGMAPDLILEGPERLVANWGARGNMVNIADMFDSTDKREIYPNVLNACYADANTAYMYPMAMTSHCMAINKTVFEAAGAMRYIDEETHTWTTDNFLRAMETVYAYTGHTVGALYCGGQGGDQGTRALVNNLYGGRFTTADHTQYTWDTEANVAALGTLYNCAAIEFDPSIVGGDEIALFYNGILNVAFCWNIAQQLNPSNANTGAGKTANGDEIMFMSFPSPNGTDAQLQGGIWGFGIFDNGNAAKIEASKAFIRYCCDSAATADAVRATNYFAVRSSVNGTSLHNLWADNAVMKEFDKMSHLIGDYYQVSPRWAEARTNWWNMLQEIGFSDGSWGEISSIAARYTANANR